METAEKKSSWILWVLNIILKNQGFIYTSISTQQDDSHK